MKEVLGNYAYRLSDGQTWNARKMRRFLEPELSWDDTAAAPDSQAAPTEPRRSTRDNRGVPPLRYPNDFVNGFM